MENMKSKRSVKVYQDSDGAWYPLEHFPHPYRTVIDPSGLQISKEVEHDAFWPDGEPKYLHRIETDGKNWYLGHPKYINDEKGRMEMIRRGKERDDHSS